MIKSIVSLFASFAFFTSLSADIPLPLYKQTPHFQAFCESQDENATDLVLSDLETNISKFISDLLFFEPLNPIQLKVYPDTSSFQKESDPSSCPSFSISSYRTKDNTILLVTPGNPGPSHTQQTAIQSARVSLCFFLINKKYGLYPDWLTRGLTLYESKMYAKEDVYKWLMSASHLDLPLITDLETVDYTRNRAASVATYAYVYFLINTRGMGATLFLLLDYPSFEKILGISKENFREECINFYTPGQ